MSDFPTPPRGSGRHGHRRNDEQPTRYERGRADTTGGRLPRVQPGDDYPGRPDSVVDSNPGLYRVPLPGQEGYDERGEHLQDLGPAISQIRMNRERRATVKEDSRTDLVVPRVYLEPDETMDRLRARALRFAIVRDALVIVLALSLVFRWVVAPLWTALGF